MEIINKLYSIAENSRDKYPNLVQFCRNMVRDVRFCNTKYYNWRNGKKHLDDNSMTIVFLCYMPEVWNSLRSVYEECCKHSNINAVVIAQPKSLIKLEENEMYEFGLRENLNVIKAYDDGKWFDVKSLNPYYIFYTRPYQSEYYSQYRPSYLKKYSKICLIPYGYNIDMGDIFDIGHNGDFICNTSYVFLSNEISWNECKRRFAFGEKIKATKFCWLGFPRFDLIERSYDYREEARCYLWIPRFPIFDGQKNFGGHFEDYFQSLYEYFTLHPDLKLIIRPHPLMFDRYREYGIMSTDQITLIKKMVNDSENIFWDTEKDYLLSMKMSDVMIADFSSLIIEYIVMNKPVIYCDHVDVHNPEFDILVEKAFYNASDFMEVKMIIEYLSKGFDEKKESRRKVLEEQKFIQQESSSKKIMDFLLNSTKC